MRTETVTCSAMLSLGVLKPLAGESWFGFFVFLKSVSSWAHKAKVTLFIYSPEIWQRYRRKLAVNGRPRKEEENCDGGDGQAFVYGDFLTKITQSPWIRFTGRQGQWISMGMFLQAELLKVSNRWWRTASCPPSPHNREKASIASVLWFWEKAFCFKVSIWLISFV